MQATNRISEEMGITQRIKLLALIIISLSATTYAQKGSIQGIVKDKTRDETLVGATVVIYGTTTGTITDFDGNFLLSNLNPGTYSIQVSFISYNTVILEGVKVEPNKSTILSIDLEEVTTELEGVVVTAVRRTSTDIAMVSTLKASPIVANGISAQQITRSQDRDASEVIKRVPGISILDGKFIVVRGLNQRYNNTWINNAPTPSTEADQKAFSFDQIPSYMIDNMIIYKSPAPDLPADFAGGFVKIFTKNMPDENFFKVSYGTSYNDQTTFKEFLLVDGGKLDWLGIDDGTRKLPSNFPETLRGLPNEELAEHGRSLNNFWDPVEKSAFPNQSASINIGKRFQRGRRQIGTITSLSYSLSNSSDDVINRGFQSGRSDGIYPDRNFDYLDREYSRTARIGLLHNWAIFPGKERKFEFKNMFNIIGKNQSIIRDGFNGYEGRTIRSFDNQFMSRITYSGQLSGEHKFGDDRSKLDWNTSFAFANRNEPDIKRLRTTLHSEPGSPYDGKYFAAIGTSPSSSDAGRVFMVLNEYLTSTSANYEYKLSVFGIAPTVKTGAHFEYKLRIFDARILGFAKNSGNPQSIWITPINDLFSDQNINTSPEGFVLRESTKKRDSYLASNTQIAGYVALNIPFTKKLNLYTGVRAEKNNQPLEGHDRYDQPVKEPRESFELFPSANLTYNLTEKHLVRLGYGKSINRAEFREIAPFYFYNFQWEADFVGNIELKDAFIQSYDFRYEFYPNAGELISLGFFYKDFTDPIEQVFRSAGNRKVFTWDNAKRATSLGSEIEIRKGLGFIPLLTNFSVVANGAYIISKVYFPEGSIERDRAMEGQSPYLVNIGLFYNSKNEDLSIGLLYNVIGDRILITGEAFQNIINDIPDIYERYRHLLDLTVSKKFGKRYEAKFGIKDILNQDIEWFQPYAAVDGGENLYMLNKQFSPGRTFSISLTVDL